MIDVKVLEKECECTDVVILLRAPKVIVRYGKEIEISQVNWFYKWPKFNYFMASFLKFYYLIVKNTKLPETLEDFEKFRLDILTTAGANPQAKKCIIKICSYAKVLGVRNNVKWMKNNFTIDDYTEIFVYEYLYNIKGVKKNLSIALKMIGQAQLN